MSAPEPNALLEEAADLFLQLRDAPQDPALLQARAAFLARGEAEQAAYARVLKAWKATDPAKEPAPKRLPMILLVLFLASGAWAGLGPLRSHLATDLASGQTPTQQRLASGDGAVLDAGTALAEDHSAQARQVRLLRGAAYFEVATDGRPFTVIAGDAEIRVLGTAFEVARIGDGLQVAVAEGMVELRAAGQHWQLAPGDRLRLDGETPRRDHLPLSELALWRQDRLVADEMSFARVAQIVGRRLPGRVQVVGAGLRAANVSGSFDLGEPLAALETLAATQDARVIGRPPLLMIVGP